MLKTRLLPEDPLPALTIGRCRELIAEARAEGVALLTKVRLRAMRRLEKARKRAYDRGYQAGLREGQTLFITAIEAARALHEGAILQAREEVLDLSYKLAESILEDTLPDRSERYRRWLAEALDILGQGQVTLVYHPGLAETVEKLDLQTNARMTLESSTTLPPMTMRLTGSPGGVEFAWKEALARTRGDQE
jgi:flagellar biosynthesis/type III secretory pathway protein FliH